MAKLPDTFWSEEEIKQLILYAKSLQQENEDLKAKLITMNAKLENEEKKTIRLSNMLKYMMNGTNN